MFLAWSSSVSYIMWINTHWEQKSRTSSGEDCTCRFLNKKSFSPVHLSLLFSLYLSLSFTLTVLFNLICIHITSPGGTPIRGKNAENRKYPNASSFDSSFTPKCPPPSPCPHLLFHSGVFLFVFLLVFDPASSLCMNLCSSVSLMDVWFSLTQ